MSAVRECRICVEDVCRVIANHEDVTVERLEGALMERCEVPAPVARKWIRQSMMEGRVHQMDDGTYARTGW